MAFLHWFKIPNLIVFHTILRININIETTYDAYYNKHIKFLHQSLHYNQTYNFAFNHDHKF
jgi:hypothetical protein